MRPIVRFEGLPAEFSQHDFGHVDVRYLDGRVERVHFFASRLKYSRWVQVSLVENEQVEALVRAMVDHFAAWGGVRQVSVFDRPKTIALEWTKEGVVTEWNSAFAGVALDLGIGVELCWPYSPEQKGSVDGRFDRLPEELERIDREEPARLRDQRFIRYLARIDGRPAGAATATFTPDGVILHSGSVLPWARGRGVYRALVGFRRAEAAALGTPTVVTRASAMSRVILLRLGFRELAEIRFLVDVSSERRLRRPGEQTLQILQISGENLPRRSRQVSVENASAARPVRSRSSRHAPPVSQAD